MFSSCGLGLGLGLELGLVLGMNNRATLKVKSSRRL